MKKWLFAVLFGSVLVLGACGNDDNNDNGATNNTGDNGGETASAAEDLFEANCAACHGADLSGAAGPNLQKVGADHSADDIKNIILNGQGAMPAQGNRVSDDEAQQIADWLAAKK